MQAPIFHRFPWLAAGAWRDNIARWLNRARSGPAPAEAGARGSREWVLRNDLPALADFCEQAQTFLTGAGLDAATLSAILLVFDEMLTNVIKYAHPGEAPGGRLITVSLRVDEEAVQIDIGDDGAPFDPAAAKPAVDPGSTVDVPLEDRVIGGWGLPLVHKMVDSFTYRREGDRNHVTLLKRRTPPPITPPQV